MKAIRDEKLLGSDVVEETKDAMGHREVKHNKGCCAAFKENFKADLKELIRTSSPITLIQISQLLLSPISLMFCGHLGDVIKLDGAALAISIINCTVISVVQGMGTACDTVFSQTIHSKNKRLVGVYVQRAMIIFTLALLPFFALHINIKPILLLAGQDPETARIASEYILIFIPGSLCYAWYIIFSKYLLNMDILFPNVIISTIANAVNAALHYILLYHYDFGIRGSAISLTTAFAVNLVLTLAYIVCSGCYKETWKGWTKECLEEWGPMTKLSISGMLMIGMEWWAFELGLLLSGILGPTPLGAQSILLQYDQIWFQVPLSIEIACSIKVGQRLGSGNTDGAKSIGWIAILSAFVLSAIPVVLYLTIPHELAHVFTNIPEIIDLTGKLMPIVALYVTFGAVVGACKGVMTGTGRQSISAILIFISYYVIALPIGIPLMFLTWLGVAAYWIGLSINMIFQTISLLIIIPRTDWEKEKNLAFERNKTAKVASDEQKGLTDSPDEESEEELRRRRSVARFRSRTLSIAHVEPLLTHHYATGRSRRYRLVQYCVIALLFMILGVSIILRLTLYA